MISAGEHILLVENSPEINDITACQAVQPFVCRMDIIGDLPSAIRFLLQTSPNPVPADLNPHHPAHGVLNLPEMWSWKAFKGLTEELNALHPAGKKAPPIHVFMKTN